MPRIHLLWNQRLQIYGEYSFQKKARSIFKTEMPLVIICYYIMYSGYSYRIASMGSRDAAFFAGYQPKNTPVTVHTANDSITE